MTSNRTPDRLPLLVPTTPQAAPRNLAVGRILRKCALPFGRDAGRLPLDAALALTVASGLPLGQLAGFGFLDLLTLFCL